MIRVLIGVGIALYVGLLQLPRYTSSTRSQDDIFLIEGDSMLPSINNGSTVVIDRNVSFNNLKVGDVVIFMAKVNTEYGTGRQNFIQQLVAHRLIRKIDSGFITKGDNNTFIDATICNSSNYLGKVIEIY